MQLGRTQRVDRRARRRTARAVIELASDRITNDQFEDRVIPLFSTGDLAVQEVFAFAWLHDDDIRPAYRLTGEAAHAGAAYITEAG